MELTLKQYMEWIGIEKDVIRYIENDWKLKEKVMFKIRHCRRRETTKDKIMKVFSNYYN